MNRILALWNAAEPEQAMHQILPCCGSRAWAKELARSRPFLSPEALSKASDEVWLSLPEADQFEALATHPRIGDRDAAATAASLKWSAEEQTNAAADESARSLLAEANHVYEARFHRTFIVCANGKSAKDIATNLNQRLANTAEAELLEAVEQQRQITNLRLAKWLAGV